MFLITQYYIKIRKKIVQLKARSKIIKHKRKLSYRVYKT